VVGKISTRNLRDARLMRGLLKEVLNLKDSDDGGAASVPLNRLERFAMMSRGTDLEFLANSCLDTAREALGDGSG
jgi:hypothetical protein